MAARVDDHERPCMIPAIVLQRDVTYRPLPNLFGGRRLSCAEPERRPASQPKASPCSPAGASGRGQCSKRRRRHPLPCRVVVRQRSRRNNSRPQGRAAVMSDSCRIACSAATHQQAGKIRLRLPQPLPPAAPQRVGRRQSRRQRPARRSRAQTMAARQPTANPLRTSCLQ